MDGSDPLGALMGTLGALKHGWGWHGWGVAMSVSVHCVQVGEWACWPVSMLV